MRCEWGYVAAERVEIELEGEVCGLPVVVANGVLECLLAACALLCRGELLEQRVERMLVHVKCTWVCQGADIEWI